jgi:surface polysaccharide O-acyltransferase-like enzyme
MCISAEASRNMFIGGVVSSVLLMKFGLKKLESYNLFLVIVFLYVILMQGIDYLVWTDLNCKLGRNKLAGILGAFLNYSQPLFVLLIGYLVLSKKINKTVLGLNGVYLLLFVYFLYSYYSKGDYCSSVDPETGNLVWNWTQSSIIKVLALGYFIVLFTNLLSFSDNNYMLVVNSLILLYVLMIMANIKNYKSIGNLWCFVTPTIIVLFLIFQLVFPKFSLNKIHKKYLRNITSM